MARIGMWEQAQETFHQALQTAEAIEEARERAEALRAITEAMARTGIRTAEAIEEAP
jgi:uncharacterized protein HemY